MTGDHVGTFAHGGEERAQVLAGDPVDPATPGAQFTPRDVRVGEEINLLQRQPHFMRLHRGEIALEQALIVRRLFFGMVRRVL